MLLAPMGCAVQDHEKMDKRGTWLYHSVDGWHLAIFPGHYRTHTYHVKAIKSKRLTDTVHFNHKNTINPTVTHGDKMMKAISACANALKGTSNGGTKLERHQLEQLQQLTSKTVAHDAIPAAAVQPAMRHNNNNHSP